MRRLILAFVSLAIVGLGLYFVRPINSAPDPKFPEKSGFVVHPYLQMATQDSITVCWETVQPGTSVVRFGVGKPTQSVASDKSDTFHEITLTGLKPGPYVYEVETTTAEGKVTSPLLTFQPAVGPDDPFSFVLIGDTQRNPKVTARLAAVAFARRPNFVVHLGDVVDAGQIKDQWVNDLLGPCRDLIARSPIYPCIGNHEKNHANYYKYFSLPQPEYFYSYTYGNAEFFSIDTNKKVGPGTEQYKWLDEQLGKSKAKWKFVYHHHPVYTSDDDDYGNTWKGIASGQGDKNARSLAPLYDKHKVDVVFTGHVHFYERSHPIRDGKVSPLDGTVYLISGGGGGSLENFAPVPTLFKAQCRSVYHICYATILDTKLSVRAFDEHGALFDVFEIEKK